MSPMMAPQHRRPGRERRPDNTTLASIHDLTPLTVT